jgi:hypothetical protein
MSEPTSSLERRVEDLAHELERLSARLARLEASVAAGMQGGAVPLAPGDAAGASDGAGDRASVAPPLLGEGESLVALVGRTFIALGGAFLLRALSEGAYLPPVFGASTGLLYALAWLLAADRDARRGRTVSAGFHALGTVAIGYPLIIEATLRFHAFSPTAAAVAALVVLASTLLVARRHGLRTIAWLCVAAAGLTELILLVGGRDLAGPGLAVLALALVVEALTHQGRWRGLRWVAAAFADLAVALAVLLVTRPDGLPEGWTPMPAALGLVLLTGLPVLYLASTAVRTLRRGRLVSPFEVVQGLVASLLGFGGTWRLLAAQPAAYLVLGSLLLLLAIAAYGVAFAFLERRAELARNFYTYGTFAAAAALSGSTVILSGPALAVVLAGLALAVLGLGIRYGRSTLRLHACLYLGAATLPAAVLPAAISGLAGAADRLPGGAAFIVTFAVGTAYLLGASRRTPLTLAGRIAQALLAVLVVLTLPGLLLDVLAGVVRATLAGAGDESVDAMRTVFLGAVAVGLAWAGRRWHLRELAWCVYPVLAVAGLDLLTHGLGHGSALALFVSLAAFGAALLLTPRLMRVKSAEGPPTD